MHQNYPIIVSENFQMSSNIFPKVLWNGILGDEEERGPEISNITNGK